HAVVADEVDALLPKAVHSFVEIEHLPAQRGVSRLAARLHEGHPDGCAVAAVEDQRERIAAQLPEAESVDVEHLRDVEVCAGNETHEAAADRHAVHCAPRGRCPATDSAHSSTPSEAGVTSIPGMSTSEIATV